MSPAPNTVRKQPLVVSSELSKQSVFPEKSHLLITTPSQICAWDSTGLHTILRSSRSGIVAAREAQDGSGLLAVADKQMVVLHDTKRGQERSWGLEANGDEVRHLEYTANAKSLFLSTNLTADIQRYSTEQTRLLSPAGTHASPPIALAVSSSGHLMVSASEGPPVVHLKNLTHNTAPVLIEPRASKAAVSVVAFHPERPNIFLLAFRDGTIAAYDATRMMRSGASSIPNQEAVNKGEVSHLTALHRPAPLEGKRSAITDAAFLPGFKTRAVTVGSDGRCRVIDFAEGGEILRTWHAKAPVTSISILSAPGGQEARRKNPTTTASHLIGGPTSTDNMIAIGRADGFVHIYDSVGLLLNQCSASENGEKIISVEWARGPSPKPITTSMIPNVDNGLQQISPSNENRAVKQAKTEQSPITKTKPSTKPRRQTLFEHVGLPPELRKPNIATPKQTTASSPRKFTVHPDEIKEGTVRHTPLPPNPKPAPIGNGDYLDLFSPVKPPGSNPVKSPRERVASPPRSRPAITSQTFVKSPEPAPATQHDTIARRRNLPLFPSTDSDHETAHPSEGNAKTTSQVNLTNGSPRERKKHITFKDNSRRNSHKSNSFKTTSVPPNSNAKILGDLRKLSAVHPVHRPVGTLSTFGPSKASQEKGSGEKENKLRLLHRPPDHIETHLNSDDAREAYEHAHERRHWPEDSNQDASLDDDIWITSGSDNDTKRSRHRKRENIQRPPGRQTSRSRITSKGTMSTINRQSGDVTSAQQLHRMDGSKEEDMFTADTHVTSRGTFSPSSKDVREMFPRSSSLSPRKRRRSKKHDVTLPKSKDQHLREIAPNEATGRLAKSPWARARFGEAANAAFEKSSNRHGITTEPIEVFEDPACATDGQGESPDEPHCAICGPTMTRVQELEAEVARLKGEVLVFKAVLRRQGVPFPPGLRPR